MNCLHAGEALVKNPMNPAQVSRIVLSPEQVDCVVFWTKNPGNFLQYLDELDGQGYRYYFQFTLTPYGREIEPNMPEKNALADIFCALSERIGKDRVIWRYDPILLNDVYTVARHGEQFEKLCRVLSGKTEKCVISFIDSYGFLKKNFAELGIRTLPVEDMNSIAAMIQSAAEKYGISLASCCEGADLARYNIGKNKCIDTDLINRVWGLNLPHKKDPGQRKECCCAPSRDIGTYHTCQHGCRYCYAGAGRF